MYSTSIVIAYVLPAFRFDKCVAPTRLVRLPVNNRDHSYNSFELCLTNLIFRRETTNDQASKNESTSREGPAWHYLTNFNLDKRVVLVVIVCTLFGTTKGVVYKCNVERKKCDARAFFVSQPFGVATAVRVLGGRVRVNNNIEITTKRIMLCNESAWII
jgi:hypothetical protein